MLQVVQFQKIAILNQNILLIVRIRNRNFRKILINLQTCSLPLILCLVQFFFSESTIIAEIGFRKSYSNKTMDLIQEMYCPIIRGIITVYQFGYYWYKWIWQFIKKCSEALQCIRHLIYKINCKHYWYKNELFL